jgi:cysteine synthase A
MPFEATKFSMRTYEKPCTSVLEAIGNTPLVELQRLGRGLPGRVFVKLEMYNPGASHKDRPALQIITAAERTGQLRPGMTVVELTSGNMGTGLAIACRLKGYHFIAVMSVGNTVERRQMLKAFGAKVVLVPQAGKPHPGQVSGEDLALVEQKRQAIIARLGRKCFAPDQFHNHNTALGHELTTGAEILEQLGGRVDYFVCTVGAGGLLAGVSRALKKHNPQTKVIVVEPKTVAILAGKRVTNTSHALQGTSYNMFPPLYDRTLIDGFRQVTDQQAIQTARRLAREEGILGGFSSGAHVSAALQLAAQTRRGSRIVTLISDSGMKYLSTHLYPA